MATTRSWSDLVVAERRRRRCRVLLVDGTSLRRGHRYVTVVLNGETGETLAIVKHRDVNALSGFLLAQRHRWMKGVDVVVSDGFTPTRLRSASTSEVPPTSWTGSTSRGSSQPA